MAKTAKNILPAYLTDIYGWLYLNPKLYNLLDNAFLLNFLTLGYHSLLTEEVKKEISPHSHILQIGATLGGQIEKHIPAWVCSVHIPLWTFCRTFLKTAGKSIWNKK